MVKFYYAYTKFHVLYICLSYSKRCFSRVMNGTAIAKIVLSGSSKRIFVATGETQYSRESLFVCKQSFN